MKLECKREVNVQQELLERIQDLKPRLNVHPALPDDIAKMEKIKMIAWLGISAIQVQANPIQEICYVLLDIIVRKA